MVHTLNLSIHKWVNSNQTFLLLGKKGQIFCAFESLRTYSSFARVLGINSKVTRLGYSPAEYTRYPIRPYTHHFRVKVLLRGTCYLIPARTVPSCIEILTTKANFARLALLMNCAIFY